MSILRNGTTGKLKARPYVCRPLPLMVINGEPSRTRTCDRLKRQSYVSPQWLRKSKSVTGPAALDSFRVVLWSRDLDGLNRRSIVCRFNAHLCTGRNGPELTFMSLLPVSVDDGR